MEYVDGVLVERSAATILHSLLQSVLIGYFSTLERARAFITLCSVRTETVRSARYRIPDLAVCGLPLPRGRVLDAPPRAIVEILSPEDSMGDTLERFREFAALGVPSIVLMDPECSIAHRFDRGSLIETKFTELDLGGRSIPFDSEALFEQFRAEYRDATEER